ncbi:hypothetical protein Bbelb_190220 [Branchiostoma belcheri]|nr:hypothetical protein Bbelb_190220 [Branchiostoma belcheri]
MTDVQNRVWRNQAAVITTRVTATRTFPSITISRALKPCYMACVHSSEAVHGGRGNTGHTCPCDKIVFPYPPLVASRFLGEIRKDEFEPIAGDQAPHCRVPQGTAGPKCAGRVHSKL